MESSCTKHRVDTITADDHMTSTLFKLTARFPLSVHISSHIMILFHAQLCSRLLLDRIGKSENDAVQQFTEGKVWLWHVTNCMAHITQGV